MPLYDYKCPKCGSIFEEFRSIAKMDDSIKCPKCATESHRNFSVGDSLGVVYVGENWPNKNRNLARHRMDQSAKMDRLQRDNHESNKSPK